MNYRIVATHLKYGERDRTFILKGESIDSVFNRFHAGHPDMQIKSVEPLDKNNSDGIIHERRKYDRRKEQTPLKQRNYFKVRLYQVRGNLQSITDSESPLLTPEEILQLQRITCKIDKVISQFAMRTMDLKMEGKI